MRTRPWLIAALCLAVAKLAAAQAHHCDRPLRPHIPVGAHAERWQMESAKQEIERYLRDMDAYRLCLKAENDAATDEARQILEQWKETVEAYKGR